MSYSKDIRAPIGTRLVSRKPRRLLPAYTLTVLLDIGLKVVLDMYSTNLVLLSIRQ
jgi:hypothetical protein